MISLISYGLWSWTSGVILLIAFMVIEGISIKKKSLNETILFLFFLLLAILHYQLYVINEVADVFRNAFLGNTYRYILCIGTWFIIRNISLDTKKYDLTDLIAPILKVHVSIFFFQFIVYFSTGKYIDFIKPVTGEESRYLSFDSSLVGIGSFRPTGLFVEPSNYAMIVLVLSSLLILFDKFSKHKKLVGLAIVSMFLSFSTAAVFTAMLLIIFIFIDQKLYKKLSLIIPLILLIAISSTTVYTLSKIQMDRLDSSAGNIRMELIKTISKRDPNKAILAYGAYGMELELFRKASGEARGERISSLNDAGVLVSMWARFGYLGILAFLIITVLMYKVSKQSLLFFLIISLTKINILSGIFILYLALAFSQKIILMTSKQLTEV